MVCQVANLPVEVVEPQLRGLLSNIRWHEKSSISFVMPSSYHKGDALTLTLSQRERELSPGDYVYLRGVGPLPERGECLACATIARPPDLLPPPQGEG